MGKPSSMVHIRQSLCSLSCKIQHPQILKLIHTSQMMTNTTPPTKSSLNSTLTEKQMISEYRSFLGSGVCLRVLCILWKRSIFICSICLQTATCPRQAVLSPGFCSVPSALWPVCSYHSILFLYPIRTQFLSVKSDNMFIIYMSHSWSEGSYIRAAFDIFRINWSTLHL